MKKIVIFILAIGLLGFFGCEAMHWSNYYPYTNVNPEKFYLNIPNDFEDCLNQFDTILSTEVITHFRGLDSTIAAIEISQGIGGLFINFWNIKLYLNGHDGSGYRKFGPGETMVNKRYKYRPGVIDSFESMGLSDPEAMMRVLFSCYHKRLNGRPYDWKTEIDKINSYWVSAKYGEGRMSLEMKNREHQILANYHFEGLKINDTVDILYNRAPVLLSRNPDWYYLTGIIEFKILETKSINVRLIEIQSEFGKNYIPVENDTINIGDTLTDYSKGWVRRGSYYFNYTSNKEYRHNFNRAY